MKSRKLVLGLLIMLAFVVSSFTYAYWTGVYVAQSEDVSGEITIGTGNPIDTTVVVTPNNPLGSLVPVNRDAAEGDESTLVLTFSVNWSGDGAAGELGTILATIEEVRTVITSPAGTHIWAKDGDVYGEMFTITVTYQDDTDVITAGTLKTVTVTVVFSTEPSSKLIYDQVAAGTLQIDLSFVVTANNPGSN